MMCRNRSDCSYSDGWKSDGTAKALTVWVPVTEVTADNGCMFVIPREFDTHVSYQDLLNGTFV